ncbi:PTS system mannose/fructose/sorbose family transporter subunit IID [Cetobacterium somerae]|uniref:PTS system mannose/fructose/sorbose family transporter subunit IID n=1 Tax=Cetobacterium somerae TaxID=188913 RepID=UPI00211E688E|nr:PTS system mannose/fructose/sorbose family transporter subunit IID [Cetobacterium somerae]MCQ9628150.1 PTS system mannose/fructose/sorbose family transporter subunit IID [Cetobacterium somerae]
MMISNKKDEKDITQKDLNKIFWRSFQMEFSWNYERQMNLAYAYAIAPILKKIYTNNHLELKKALKRHLEFFNMTPWIVTLMLGISVVLEEENKKDGKFDENSINGIKTALMGPLSGIGDSFFWGTLRLIATGIGTALSLQGNILGPILFLLVFNIPHIIIRYLFIKLGYKLGVDFLTKLEKSGAVEKVTYGATILGLIVIGGMTARMVDISTPLVFKAGGSTIEVQSILDDIMPGILKLGIFGVVYYLLNKNVKPITILLGMAIFGIFGTLVGFF